MIREERKTRTLNWVVTRGVRNTLYAPSGRPLGHVLFIDYDSIRVEKILQETRNLAGYSLILETSPEKYHYVNLNLFTMREILKVLNRVSCDPMFREVGVKRGSFVLRVGEKVKVVDGNPQVVKPRPRVIRFWRKGTCHVSLPHLWVYNVLSEKDLLAMIDIEHEAVKGDIVIEDYLTVG